MRPLNVGKSTQEDSARDPGSRWKSQKEASFEDPSPGSRVSCRLFFVISSLFSAALAPPANVGAGFPDTTLIQNCSIEIAGNVRSQAEFGHLHVELFSRDNLEVTSYALVEHCRSISVTRIIFPRLAQLTPDEIRFILHRLQRLVGL